MIPAIHNSGTPYKSRVAYTNHISVLNQYPLYSNAVKLFDKIWNPDSDKKVRALCVGVSNLTDVYKVQLSIFNDNVIEKKDELKDTIDNIRKKYGDKSITFADKINKN